MSDRRADSAALRFLIGHDLRTARERAGITQAQAARALGCHQSKIVYLETGKTQQRPAEATALLKAYDADIEHIDRIASLAARADRGTWWAQFSDVLPDWFTTYVGLEGLADSQFIYQSKVLPGQVQTPEYIAALVEGNLQVRPMDVPQLVKGRLSRQRLAGDDHPLQFRSVIEESVLDRMVGGQAVMRAQLEHLLALMQRDNVELHVMPISVAVHDGLDGDFELLDFDAAQAIGYLEFPMGAVYVQEQERVDAYKLQAERMCAVALSATESAEVVANRIVALNR